MPLHIDMEEDIEGSLHRDMKENNKEVLKAHSFKENFLKCRGSPDTHHDTSLDCGEPPDSAVQATIMVRQDPNQLNISNSNLFDKIKNEHDLAKAVKNDDAACLFIYGTRQYGQERHLSGVRQGTSALNPPSHSKGHCSACANTAYEGIGVGCSRISTRT